MFTMTNALIKTMRDKLGDSVTKEIIYQGCIWCESKYRTKALILKKYAKNNAEIAEKKKWIEEFAKNYWNGKNGAWVIKSLEIKEMK